ncbi:MAG TPA: EFR1 family ferrodoxin [Ruminiclostridium sp.]|nr:EFR1 family ferrodoxin [Ruminiclostridium sp.]
MFASIPGALTPQQTVLLQSENYYMKEVIKMKTAVIFYFSGTGNTELVACMLRDTLSKREYVTELIRMEDVLKNKIPLNVSGYDLIGIGSQVIGFGAPRLVYEFIKALPKANGQKTFVFRTAGGVAPVNYNASKPMMRRLKRKGYDVFYERIFSISSNWISKFDDDVIIKLHEATQKKVGLMCDGLVKGEQRILKTGFMQRMMMECVMFTTPFFFRMAGKRYAVKDTCTHCGQCVKNCPAGNITMEEERIRFHSSCSLCMRCIYSCPKNAIYLKSFAFFAVPGGYNIKKILAQPCAVEVKDKKPEPRFLKEYLANDAL